MDNVMAKVEGLDDILKAFDKISTIVDDQIVVDALKEESEYLADHIRRHAPKGKTGNLRRSITGKLLKKRNNHSRAALTAIDFRFAQHAHLVEYGHGGSQPAPAHPFFRPAIRSYKYGHHIIRVMTSRLIGKWK